MQVTIVRDDGIIGINGEFRVVDLTALDPNIHAVQWDGVNGHVEFKTPKSVKKISSIVPYQSFIDAWAAAASPAQTLDDLKDVKESEFIAEGVKRVAARVADWDTLDTIKTVAGLWPAISASATPAQLRARDIYLYVRDTVPAKIAALTTQAGLDAIDAALADPFGDGTAWPA